MSQCQGSSGSPVKGSAPRTALRLGTTGDESGLQQGTKHSVGTIEESCLQAHSDRALYD